MINLAEGLAINPTLRILSLQYCGIDALAAEAIFQILIYTRSALEDINLSGNMLGNEGIIKVLQGCSVAKTLKKIWCSDNQFNDEEDVLKAIMFNNAFDTNGASVNIIKDLVNKSHKSPNFDCQDLGKAMQVRGGWENARTRYNTDP